MDPTIDFISPMRSEYLQIMNIMLHCAYVKMLHESVLDSYSSLHHFSESLPHFLPWYFEFKYCDRFRSAHKFIQREDTRLRNYHLVDMG